MSVLLELNIGDIVIDLHTNYAPKACENFLKLCKLKYYNFSPIYNVQKDFSFQTGDPLGGSNGTGGDSIWGMISRNPKDRWFAPEFHPKLKHAERGTVSLVCRQTSNDESGLATSKFFITLGDNIDYLDGKHAIFGRVAEGFDVLEQISNALCDDDGLPYRDIRIKHTIVLEDPYPDPPGLVEPPSSPLPTEAQLATVRISEAEEHADDNLTEEEIARRKKAQQARTEALTLEMVGDLPFAEVAPPENILFVCKLNRATRDEDLELIFSRFGNILSCEIIKDKRSGDSLQYAFIEFAEKKDCEQAYFKMEGVLIDDRRIHVDFSQSVSKLSDAWRNSTNSKRRMAAAHGYGGSSKLKQRTTYRNDKNDNHHDHHQHHHQMMFEDEDLIHSRHRSRSPRRR